MKVTIDIPQDIYDFVCGRNISDLMFEKKWEVLKQAFQEGTVNTETTIKNPTKKKEIVYMLQKLSNEINAVNNSVLQISFKLAEND